MGDLDGNKYLSMQGRKYVSEMCRWQTKGDVDLGPLFETLPSLRSQPKTPTLGVSPNPTNVDSNQVQGKSGCCHGVNIPQSGRYHFVHILH